MQTSIVIPILDEVENLKILLPKLLSPDWEIIICDNGSSDGSVRLVEDAVIDFNIKLSRGSGSVADAVIRGLREATSSKIIVMDGDLSHSPDAIPEMIERLDRVDLVVGSRYVKGGRSRDSLSNKIISWGLGILTWMLAPKIKDRVSGFFGIRKEFVSTPIRATSKPMLEFLVRANPLVVEEVPYTFEPRRNGSSSIGRSPRIIVSTLVDVFLLYLQRFNRFVKFCLIGGVGTLIVLGLTYILTEYAGFWYMSSVVISAFAAAVWNFTGNRLWTFSTKKSSEEGDYEWNAWYRGNPIQKWWKRRIGYLTKELLGDPESLLDIGCGSSPVINLFTGRRSGLEGSLAKVSFIRQHSTAIFIVGDLDGQFKVNSSFEAVICNNVLEHLEKPEKVVEGIGRVLVPGGLVVITVPNVDNPATKLIEWLYGKIMPGGYAEDHVYEFTPSSLDELCSRHKLDLVTRKLVATDMVCLYKKRFQGGS